MFWGLRLDHEIVDLLIELNKAGFSTYTSCAGHRSGGSGKGMIRGYIGFERCNDKEGIVKMLETYGLRNIRIQDQVEDSGLYKGEVTMVSFDPIGKPQSHADDFDDIFDPLDYKARQLELLRPPGLQCVSCWHRWQPAEWFKNTPKCPVCQSTWLIKVEDINMALRKEHEHSPISSAQV